MVTISEAIEPSELLDLEHIEKERTPSENDTHWKLRLAFLQRFRNEFPRDRLRSLSMIFCNVTFLNCSYSPVMMKRVGEFSAALHDDVKIAKRFKLARKTFSLPILDSDEDDPQVFDVDSVLCTIKDDGVLPTEAMVPTHVLDGLNALNISPPANDKSQRTGGSRASPILGPGVFHISVIESADDAKPKNKKNKKKRIDTNYKPKQTNGGLNMDSRMAAVGDTAATKSSTEKRSKNRIGKSASTETKTTEDLFRSLINNKADHKKKKEKRKKETEKIGGDLSDHKTALDDRLNTIVELSH